MNWNCRLTWIQTCCHGLLTTAQAKQLKHVLTHSEMLGANQQPVMTCRVLTIQCARLILADLVISYSSDTIVDSYSSQCNLWWMHSNCADWLIEQCFTSPPTQYRLYGRRFLQVKRPNQQYHSTEGESCKGKNPKNKENKNYTCITHTKLDKYSIHI